MATMKRVRSLAFTTAVIFIGTADLAIAGVGFATRDLNPMLQPIFLPGQVPFSSENGWRIDHSFFVTNTAQDKRKGDERLTIDVENYRYELGLRYRKDNWLGQVDIPFIANNGGELDGLIEDWHDFFGLSNGDRNDLPGDDIKIEYVRGGVVEYSQDKPSSGVGDISVVLGYQLTPATRYFLGIDLPTGSESDFSGNEAIDIAIWVSHELQIDKAVSGFGMLGLSIPGDDGNLKGLVTDQIWVAQIGLDYRFGQYLIGTIQFDLHSATVKNSELAAFGNSLQIQIGLGFAELFGKHRLDLFFSEDILVGSAPDISFGARLIQEF